ncbi:MAG: hypothetical protein J7545_11465 [Roseofilum sp. SBFL]|uniref:hypothetical protein n=1 Tax=unclassified Roseofilum TaxID=2620099 RepID=UPI001B12DA38|nr:MULTISPECIES: hypothetical protein [unclassified Roseofilum]MBP0013116.1 hypothetical protein [Roseofilum sp. SID3]MBP0023716.1 hypothetical protein [Roseofilum sp. SID2]MBP0042578.1 hypothetical protein [Roseofilum sp. SBFL]
MPVTQVSLVLPIRNDTISLSYSREKVRYRNPFPIPHSLFPIPYSPFPIPHSLFPIP